MRILDTLYDITKRAIEESSNHMVIQELRTTLLYALKSFNRFNAKQVRREALNESIEYMDDAKVLLKLCIELKCIDYDVFKIYEENLYGLVKMMVAEKNIIFGSKKAVAERSLGR